MMITHSFTINYRRKCYEYINKINLKPLLLEFPKDFNNDIITKLIILYFISLI